MHYPIPRNGIEHFKDQRITVSNYGGEARIYLENLIKASGAEFTKTMKGDNTHLITARNSSAKCQAAPEWGITVVNHLWLEESYAKCEFQPENIQRYNHFPPRTNLGEIIGQTFFDESRLRELYYPGGEGSMSPRAKRKRKMLEAAEENAYQHGPAEGVVIGRTPQEKDSDAMVDESEGLKKRQTKKLSTVATPIRSRRAATGKENNTPSIESTGGRSAKVKARETLQMIAPDIALYEQERKRNGKTGPWGGKRATDLLERGNEEKQQVSSPAQRSFDDDERKQKKARPSLPEVDIRIVLTGFGRWVSDKHKEDVDRVWLPKVQPDVETTN